MKKDDPRCAICAYVKQEAGFTATTYRCSLYNGAKTKAKFLCKEFKRKDSES
ncbi:MAG: hypothetical protein HUK08_00300 [Bacteroidaceae bacterium]|nr:hypothetical protein [Bacteroidaceae bacterium]